VQLPRRHRNAGLVHPLGTNIVSEELYGGQFAFNTTNAFHTYRFGIVGTDGPLNVYLDGDTSPIQTFRASTQPSTGSTSRPARRRRRNHAVGLHPLGITRPRRPGSATGPGLVRAGQLGRNRPNAVGAEVNFLGAITAPRTVLATAP